MKKLNKFDAFMILGIIALIVLGAVLLIKLNNKETSYTTTIEEVYSDSNNLIDIYPDGVIDFVYHTQDNEYKINYCDEDSFDQDDMLYNEEYNYYYIEIYVDSADFYDYLSMYNSIGGRYDERFRMSSSNFGIDEYIDTINNLRYYRLQRK